MCIISYLYPVEICVAEIALHTQRVTDVRKHLSFFFSYVHKPLGLAVVSSSFSTFVFLAKALHYVKERLKTVIQILLYQRTTRNSQKLNIPLFKSATGQVPKDILL